MLPARMIFFSRAGRSNGDDHAAGRASSGWESEIRLSVEVNFPTWLLFDCLAALAPGTCV